MYLRYTLLIFSLLWSSPGFSQFAQCHSIFKTHYFSEPYLESLHESNQPLIENIASSNHRLKTWSLLKLVNFKFKKMASFWQKDFPDNPPALLMLPSYIGESFWSTTVLLKTGLRFKVKYLSAEERSYYEVDMTSNGFTHVATQIPFKQNKSGIFVISMDGKIYMQWEQKTHPHHFRHSSFMAGTPVLYAGYMTVSPQGVVTLLTRGSGHYRPSKARRDWAKQFLIDRGFTLNIASESLTSDLL